jgi:hypothetical protein
MHKKNGRRDMVPRMKKRNLFASSKLLVLHFHEQDPSALATIGNATISLA